MKEFVLIIAIFSPFLSILGLIIKFYQISSMPLNVRWEIYPVPHESKKYGGSYLEEVDWAKKPINKNIIGEFIEPAKEIFLLHRVKKFNPYGLWLWSLMLHWGIWLIFLWIAIITLNSLFKISDIMPLSFIPLVSYLSGLLGCLGLIVKRISNINLKLYTAPIDYFNLLFLFLLFGSGLLMLINDPALSETKAYIDGIFSLDIPLESISWFTILHFIILELFILYIPFSRFFHGPVKFFTFHSILWDDQYQTKNSKIEKKVTEQLNYKLRWSGPHIVSEESWLENAKNLNLHDKV